MTDSKIVYGAESQDALVEFVKNDKQGNISNVEYIIDEGLSEECKI
jgi:hypothetical protein